MANERSSDGRMLGSTERRELREAALQQWLELKSAIGTARAMRMLEPDFPIPKVGRFEGVEYRDHGGFGVVFIVRDPELQRDVVVKFSIVKSEETHELLLREARLMAKLSHPNIVTVHEVGCYGDSDDGEPFIVMEYIEGRTGHDFVTRKPKPSWSEIAALYRGAGAGLAAAHKRGVVHGDFKPANILIDADDWPRVTDFGFAHYDTSGDEDPGEGLGGTWAFMAPEVLEGQDADHLSDQFSFCVSLWLTLDGAFPFAVRSKPSRMRRAIHKGPRVHDDEVPEQLRAIARRGLSVDPRDRFPDMSAVVAELDRVLVELKAGESAATESPLAVERHVAAGESATELELPAPARPLRAKPAPAYRRRLFTTNALSCGVTALLMAFLFTSVRGERSAEQERLEELAPADARVIPAPPKPLPGCASGDSMPAHITLICQAIRAGDVKLGAEAWESVHENAYPDAHDPLFADRLGQIVRQTEAVHDTLIEVSQSSDYSAEARATAAGKASAVWVVYEKDSLNLSSSP